MASKNTGLLTRKHASGKLLALQIPLLFILLRALWVIFPEKFLIHLLPPAFAGISTPVLLDCAYVMVMAFILYLVFKPETESSRQISEALRESNQFNMEIISSAVEGIVVYDREFRYMLWNPFMEKMTGVKAAHVLGRKAADLFPHLKEYGVIHLFERALGGETVASPDIPFRTVSSGKTGWVSAVYGPHRDAQGKIIGVTASIRDITERKKIEETKLQMAAIIENTSDLAAIGDENGGLLYINAAGRAMLGIGREEDISKAKIRDFHPAQDAEIVMSEGIPSAISNGVWTGETTFLARDGRKVPASQVIVSHKKRDGKVDFIATVARDISERRRTRENLTLSEKRFSAVFDLNPNPSAITEEDSGRIIDVNRAFCEWAGYSRPELVGRNTLELGIWVFPEERIKFVEAVRSGERMEKKEVQLRNREGKIGWFLFLACRLILNDRAYIYSTAEDITDRKEAAEALAKSEAKLRSVFAAAPVVIGIAKDRKIEWLNDRFEQVTGYPAEEILGRDSRILYGSDEDYRRVGNLFYEQLRKNENARIDSRWRSKDGKVIDIELGGSSLSSGDPSRGIVFTALDITERRRMETALTESEERFRQIFDHMSSSVAVYEAVNDGADFTFKDFNRSAEASEQLRKEDVLGKSVLELFPAVKEFGLFEIFQRVWRTGQPEFFPLKLYKDNRLTGWRENYVCKLPNGDIVAIYDDVTARKQAEEAIHDLNVSLEQKVAERTRQLEEAVKELEAFSYSASHDLRAPLRAMNGFANALLEDYAGKLDVPGQRYLNLISSGAKNMGRLIDDLLAFSHMGRREIAYGDVDMQSLAGAVIEELKVLAPDRAVEWGLRPLAACTGDASMLRQVWINLLTNAVKFTRPRNPARIEIGSEEKANEILYYVKDNGVGFDMQYSEKLFKVFQRLHSPGEFEGTGVGLAVVQLVVHRHGGRIWAEGKEGIGADFYFTLPKAEIGGS